MDNKKNFHENISNFNYTNHPFIRNSASTTTNPLEKALIQRESEKENKISNSKKEKLTEIKRNEIDEFSKINEKKHTKSTAVKMRELKFIKQIMSSDEKYDSELFSYKFYEGMSKVCLISTISNLTYIIFKLIHNKKYYYKSICDDIKGIKNNYNIKWVFSLGLLGLNVIFLHYTSKKTNQIMAGLERKIRVEYKLL